MTDGGQQGLAARRAAYKAVRRVHSTGAWSVQAVDSALRGSGLDPRDRSFAASLAYETLRWEGTLDWALARVLTRPLSAVQPELLDLLRLGAWQILKGGVPDRAAVGTAVDLARSELGPQATGFANGVLRGLARRHGQLPWPSPDDDDGLALALGYPEWIVRETRAVFGDRARAVLEAGNAAPGLTLRAAPPDTRDALVEELTAQGAPATPTPHATAGIRTPGTDPSTLPAVAEGRATPQDEASMLVVEALAAALGDPAGLRVFDAAAAPGGKATHLAALGADVVAGDVRPGRVRLIAEAAARLHVGARVRSVVADAQAPPFPPASFDAVLLDAPCSGLGVVRRRPELRWRRDPGDPERLALLQGRLLEALAALVRPGGVLCYAACTWTRAETTGVVRDFLAIEGDHFTPLDPAAAFNGAGTPLADAPVTLLDPDRDGTDGFAVTLLQRTR